MIEGEFKKLLSPKYFRSVVYPGRTVDKGQGLPYSLKELLRDDRYTPSLLKEMPEVLAHGQKVLHNVKAKGAAMGDVMTPETENHLYPQVMMEAFGRKVKIIVDDVHREAMRVATATQVELASPYAVTATWDQATRELLHGVVDDARCCGSQSSFLGLEWVSLLRKDAARLARTTAEPFDTIPGSQGGTFKWLDPTEIDATYVV